MNHRRIVLVAHNVRSLWNVGSFFRTADAFSIEHVYFTGYTPTPPRREISKTAIGADEWIPWSHVQDPQQLLCDLKSQSYTIVALELASESVELSAVTVPDDVPICVVVGNEILGVPSIILSLADVVAKIPMLGRKHSLNVSVALGIALYHFRES